MRKLAAVVAVALTAGLLGGCTAALIPTAPKPAATSPATQNRDFNHCHEVSAAADKFGDAVNASNGSAEAYANAAETLAFDLGGTAVKADRAELKAALQEASTASAALADAIRHGDGADTSARVAFQVSFDAALDACKLPAVDWVDQ